MIRRLASAALLGLLWCGAALAWAPPSPVVELLEHSTDPADLRARLRAHRDSVASSDSRSKWTTEFRLVA